MPLPSRNRLNLRLIGDCFYDKSRRIHTSHFTVFTSPNSLGIPRFAIVVSKKIDSLSVVRNHLRRQASAIIQKNISTFTNSLDIVLSFKTPIKDLSFEQLDKSISSLLISISQDR